MVVTAAGGLPELVADGSGRVVEPGDAAALGTALVEVLVAPEVATSLGAQAAAGGREADWPRVAELTIDGYRRHLPRTRARKRALAR
jgi:glycosyltransferase involved in cell wall biosynthesis